MATGVKARVANNGQSCIAAKRALSSPTKLRDKFESAFVAQMQKPKVGDPFDATTDVGPLANAEAVACLMRTLQSSIKADKAKVLTGGKPVDGPGGASICPR